MDVVRESDSVSLEQSMTSDMPWQEGAIVASEYWGCARMQETTNQYAVRISVPNNALYIAVDWREVGEKRIGLATACVQTDGGKYPCFDRHRDFESA
ncbi:hypothetical protein BCY88_21635 [Paraburkholderia fungorum]|uniref:Uncharacterized protein n=1 Tax=Paraburkholderia fungorum TaxID=134537 RepID=A0A3R7IBB3_9BURK|nr:hypothetical protein BCY88_21635 [Paraburkholderia fungorum]